MSRPLRLPQPDKYPGHNSTQFPPAPNGLLLSGGVSTLLRSLVTRPHLAGRLRVYHHRSERHDIGSTA